MPLSVRHQWALRRIEYSLRRSDRQFAATMSALASLVLEGNMPQHERLAPPHPWRGRLAASALLRLMLLCAAAARLSCRAARWLGTELKAVLRTGRHPHHAAGAGNRGGRAAQR